MTVNDNDNDDEDKVVEVKTYKTDKYDNDDS